ncbi:MAG: efflux RND transporter periplasmic adaptor subunit [Pseudomonadota bacterium]
MLHLHRFAVAVSMLVVTLIMPGSAVSENLVFQGQIEANQRGVLSSQLDGVISEVRFIGGEPVEKGQVLITLDPRDAELAMKSAEATLTRALAEQENAQSAAERQERLSDRGVASDAEVIGARTALAVSRANVQSAQATLERAKLDLSRTEIRSPVTGFVSTPKVSPGTFVEAESGAPLGEVLALDPVVVAYRAPYADRLATLEQTNVDSVDALLRNIRISLTLPGGRPYPETATPHVAEATVDPATGTITIRARIANPDLLLRPGMAVTVHSEVVQ